LKKDGNVELFLHYNFTQTPKFQHYSMNVMYDNKML